MRKHYQVTDMTGRLWVTTMTASKAVKVAAALEKDKGLKCQVKEIVQGGKVL